MRPATTSNYDVGRINTLPREQTAIDLLVAPRGTIPASVEAHGAPDERPPSRKLAGSDGALDSADQPGGRWLVEKKPGARLELRVGIDNRVAKSTRRVGDRNGPIALTVHLHQSAGLVPTRDDHEVRARDHSVHQRFLGRLRKEGIPMRLRDSRTHARNERHSAVAGENELSMGVAEQASSACTMRSQPFWSAMRPTQATRGNSGPGGRPTSR